jgi:hypothetical protein
MMCLHIITLCLLIAIARAGEIAPDPDRGLYSVWSKPEISDRLTFLKGNQIHLEWGQVQPAADRYDFSELHHRLARTAELGRKATVEMDAYRLPAFLFDMVPATRGTMTKEQDRRGTLQYWHPAYVKAYTGAIAALAREIKSSPHRDLVIGVRLNYNAIGTEFLIVKESADFVAPPGVTVAPPWTEEIAANYRRTILETFAREFTPQIRVFLRSGNPQYRGPDAEALHRIDSGNFGIFTTATEIEPRMPTMFDGATPVFAEYCRTGRTACFAEPMADAAGRHGPLQDPRWCPPAQYNYWRLLSDLNLGFSFLGIYGGDLAHAGDPEYQAAFDFARRYAGYHASPSLSPGAWVALREGGGRLRGDYTFLMRRLPGNEMRPEQKVGPDDQRFGAWARTLVKGTRGLFELDPRFAAGIAGKDVVLRAVYLDRGAGAFTIHAVGREFRQALGASGRWQTAAFKLNASELKQFAVDGDTDITFHMMEVVVPER